MAFGDCHCGSARVRDGIVGSNVTITAESAWQVDGTGAAAYQRQRIERQRSARRHELEHARHARIDGQFVTPTAGEFLRLKNLAIEDVGGRQVEAPAAA